MVMMRSVLGSKLMFVLLALIGIVIGGAIRFYTLFNPDMKAVKASLTRDELKPINVLFVGIDEVEGSHRADAIALVTIDLNSKRIGFLSIPRDTRVRIPNRGWTKINHAYAYGGISLLKETLEDFLSLPIDHYISIDYRGFVKLIDMIGGVDLYVEKDMKYSDKWAGFYINLKKGYQRLDGSKALQYVRYRNDPEGDIGRVKRHKKFLEAVINRLKEGDIVGKLPSLALEAVRFVKTDLTPEQIMYLISFFRGFDFSEIKWDIVPGQPGYIDGVSYWLPNLDKLDLVKKRIVYGEKIELYTEKEITIEILNGNGVFGAANKVSRVLGDYGYKVLKTGNADRLDYSITKVLDNTGENLEIAKRIVEILGYGVPSSERRDSEAMITIILGRDMR